MSDKEETKPERGLETKRTDVEDAKPEEGRDATTSSPSDDAAEPSSETVIPRQKYDDALRGMNESQRRAADAERRAAEAEAQALHYRNLAQAAAGVVKQHTDPVAAAEAEYRGALDEEGYFGPRTAEAQQRLIEARQDRKLQEMFQQFTQRQRVESELPRAKQMLGVEDDRVAATRLQEIAQSLTPADLALVGLSRTGKLNDYLAGEQKRREESARQADALRSLGGAGGRLVPGSTPNGTATKKRVDWVTFRMASKAVQEAIKADPNIEVVNVPEI